MKSELADALARGQGVLCRREHPDLHRHLDHCLRTGHLVQLLRGAYCRPEESEAFGVRARAVRAADPAAVLTGATAARLHGWEEVPEPTTITAASRVLQSREGFRFTQRRVPPRLVRTVDGVPITSRALTALDLVDMVGAGVLDDALRRGVTLDELWQALHLAGPRRGDALRRRLLEESRTEPWSEAERSAHRLMERVRETWPRQARTPLVWRANRRVFDRDGVLVAICDIALEPCRVDIEIDGDAYHASTSARARDRTRDRRMAMLGWRVARFGAGEIRRQPDAFVAAVLTLARPRERSGGSPGAGRAPPP